MVAVVAPRVPNSRRARTPLALVAGGLAWTAWSAAAALQRGDGDPFALLVALSGLLVVVGLVGLVVAFAWTYRFPGGEGAGLAAAGGVLFAAGQVATVVPDQRGLATWLIAPGALALVGGAVLLGAGIVRARRVPPWIGVVAVVGSVCFLGFNRVPALALPFGLAWIGLGIHLRRHPERPTDHLEPSAVGR